MSEEPKELYGLDAYLAGGTNPKLATYGSTIASMESLISRLTGQPNPYAMSTGNALILIIVLGLVFFGGGTLMNKRIDAEEARKDAAWRAENPVTYTNGYVESDAAKLERLRYEKVMNDAETYVLTHKAEARAQEQAMSRYILGESPNSYTVVATPR